MKTQIEIEIDLHDADYVVLIKELEEDEYFDKIISWYKELASCLCEWKKENKYRTNNWSDPHKSYKGKISEEALDYLSDEIVLGNFIIHKIESIKIKKIYEEEDLF